MKPHWMSHPRTMDQILSNGGKCGPRAWFGRFICQAFGIPIWGVRQPGHAAMSRWTEKGWMVCLGAAFAFSWWEDRCGLDFKLETTARGRLSSPAAYLQQVQRLEWLAKYKKESNKTILKSCTYDPIAPFYALSLAQRHRLAKSGEYDGDNEYYPRSNVTVPKIVHVKATAPTIRSLPTITSTSICIPADSMATAPSNKVLVMPSFTGGRQVFLGTDAIIEFQLEEQWLPPRPQIYRLSVKVATAHIKDTALMVKVTPRAGCETAPAPRTYHLPLPYSKGLWRETESIDIFMGPDDGIIAFQREWRQSYGISIKHITLEPSPSQQR